MKITTTRTLLNGVYEISIATSDWSELDRNLMQEFGEPEINVGGEIPYEPSFDLPNRYCRIMTETPFTQAFDVRDFVDARERIEAWDDYVYAALVAAVTTLRAQYDTFTGETVETVYTYTGVVSETL